MTINRGCYESRPVVKAQGHWFVARVTRKGINMAHSNFG